MKGSKEMIPKIVLESDLMPVNVLTVHKMTFEILVILQKEEMMKLWSMMLCFAIFSITICNGCNWNDPYARNEKEKEEVIEDVITDYGGGGHDFKVPLPKGYDWEVTQSWDDHCDTCNEKYPSLNFCKLSHSGSCCKYAWDFNLPGTEDMGKPILATSNGTVREVSYSESWGNYVVLDHGSNLCSRYAHMKSGSHDHLSKGQFACQGLKIGEIGNTGFSQGSHLHFHFEECGTEKSIRMNFSDGNDVPMCTTGEDVFNNGQYNFLRLTNTIRYNCGDDDSEPNEPPDDPIEDPVDDPIDDPIDDPVYECDEDTKMSDGYWIDGHCGNLSGCIRVLNCGRQYISSFSDQESFGDRTFEAAAYLWTECAIDYKSSAGFRPNDHISFANALKISMSLYGLLPGCGTVDPLSDADSDEWFYPLAVCAHYNGIVGVTSYLSPNSDVSFADASKLAVESALKAGKIQIYEPTIGHFPHINNAHWAYKYVETIFAYGGLSGSLRHSRPDQKITREQYAIMTTSLSPCFCGNVHCDGDCECNQIRYECSVPEDEWWRDEPEDGDTDSGSQDDPDGDEPDDNTGDPHDYGSQDIDMNCYVDVDHTDCEEDGTELHIKCSVTNNTGRELKINDLYMNLVSGGSGVCEVTDPHLQDGGVGTKNVDDGETKTLSGHWEVTCSSMPSNRLLTFSFDLVERIDGERTYEDDISRVDLVIERSFIEVCQ